MLIWLYADGKLRMMNIWLTNKNKRTDLCIRMGSIMEMFHIINFIFLLPLIACNNNERNSNILDANVQSEIYKDLLKHKRAEQLEAVKRILSMSDYAKQFKMVSLIYDQITKVMLKAKQTLESSGFVAGDAFPTEVTVRDALANVIENCALFGEILLRMPDITHKIMKKNHETSLIISWSIGFTNDTGLIDAPTRRLLNLVAQELELIPRDPHYVNPYKFVEPVKPTFEEHQEKKPVVKKKKKPRGPQLSNQRHTEL